MNRDRQWMLLAAPWVLMASACGRQAPPPPKPATVVVARPVARRQVVSGVTLTGTAEPKRTARLVSQVEGEVELLVVREGDPVRVGQVLLRVDPSRLQAAFDEAHGDELAVKADLEDTRRVLERDRVLFDRQGIGRERLEGSETAVRRLEAGVIRAQARVAGLAAQLADTAVKAPFDGYVLERRIELGDVVKSGSPLLSIASGDAHVLAPVSESDLGHLRLGDEARLVLGSAGGELTARITRIRPQVDPATRTATVEITPTTDIARLLPGMLVGVTLTLARRDNVLAAPADAVLVRPDGSRTLFVVDSNTAVQRKVSTGLEGGGWVEVVEGLREGDLIVLQGQERLKDGALVAIKGSGAQGKKQAPPGDQAEGRGQSPDPRPSGAGGGI